MIHGTFSGLRNPLMQRYKADNGSVLDVMLEHNRKAVSQRSSGGESMLSKTAKKI